VTLTVVVSVLFSEPKIPQSGSVKSYKRRSRGFSALQRAENSSTSLADSAYDAYLVFQCSSASRKFLNGLDRAEYDRGVMFQCSSASRKFLNRKPTVIVRTARAVSVLFSEPKIPQHEAWRRCEYDERVSVLFSEPKIPQLSSG